MSRIPATPPSAGPRHSNSPSPNSSPPISLPTSSSTPSTRLHRLHQFAPCSSAPAACHSSPAAACTPAARPRSKPQQLAAKQLPPSSSPRHRNSPSTTSSGNTIKGPMIEIPQGPHLPQALGQQRVQPASAPKPEMRALALALKRSIVQALQRSPSFKRSRSCSPSLKRSRSLSPSFSLSLRLSLSFKRSIVHAAALALALALDRYRSHSRDRSRSLTVALGRSRSRSSSHARSQLAQ